MPSCHIIYYYIHIIWERLHSEILRGRNQLLCYRNFLWFKCTYWLLFGDVQCYILHLIHYFWVREMNLNEGYIKINSMRSKSLVFLLSSIGPGEELLYQDGVYVFGDFMSPGWSANRHWGPWALFLHQGTVPPKKASFWFIITNCSSGTGRNVADKVFCHNQRRWKNSI